MTWHTKITEMTGIKYPIIQGAFAVIGLAEFAAAFSNAGGLGIITALNFKEATDFEAEIKKMKKITDKPFGVNFSVFPPYMIERQGGRGFNEEFYLDFVDVAIKAGVKIYTTSAYQAPNLGKIIKDAGCYWFHKCTTVKHALAAKKAGADAITFVGLEGTGFKNPNQHSTLVNVTIGKEILKIPIIAAGGIGDARGFLGALAMGADAVCFGSAIIPTTECTASDKWKNQLLKRDIFNERFHKKIFHLKLKDSSIGSMAVGHIEKSIPIKQFIDNIINGAEWIKKEELDLYKTRITEMTGSKYPIIMGAFVKFGTAAFAATFSNAGGFGIITASNYKTPIEFQNELKLMKELTNEPFGINFSVMPPEIAEKNPKARTEDSYMDFIDIAIESGVKIFTTSGYQAKNIGKKVHDASSYWFHKCAILKHALKAERAGADAVTLVGLEGAGAKHPYQNTTLVNITMARKLLKIPVIAAGGIGDAKGFIGALAMGADAVCFGTAILTTKECPAPERYKNKIINQDIFDYEYYKKIYNFDFKDISVGSLASGHFNKSIPVKEFIEEKIIKKSEEILKSW